MEDGMRCQRAERRLLGGLPDDGVAAAQCERGVPGPDGDGKVERGDDADCAERVPGLHHAMGWALGGKREAGELTREAGGEAADVDDLLHLAEAFGENLSGLDGDESSEVRERCAKLIAEQTDQLASFGCRHIAPFEVGAMRVADRFGGCERGGPWNLCDGFAGDGGVYGQVAGRVGLGRDAELGEQRADFILDGGGRGVGHKKVSLSATNLAVRVAEAIVSVLSTNQCVLMRNAINSATKCEVMPPSDAIR